MVKQLIDYEEFCGVKPVAAAASAAVPEITVEERSEVRRRGPDYLLDVREPHSIPDCAHPRGDAHPARPAGCPLRRVAAGVGREEVIVMCRSGARSAKAVTQLKEQGIEAKNLQGGVLAWSDRIDPTQPKY